MSSSSSKGKTSKPDDQKRRIMHQRAEKLAKAIVTEKAAGTYLEILIFRLASERYALEIRYIKEVHPVRDLTPLPGTPNFVAGLLNIRRRILSVIDLKPLFSLSDDKSGDQRAIIIRNDQKEFALLADEVIGIERVSEDKLEAPLPTHTGIRLDFLQGVTSDGTVILDGKKLLSSRRLVLDETVEIA